MLCKCTFGRGHRRIERVAIGRLQIVDYEIRIGNDVTIVLDIGQLALGRLDHVAVVDQLEGQAGHAHVGFQLHAERACVGQPERGGELMNLDHESLRPCAAASKDSSPPARQDQILAGWARGGAAFKHREATKLHVRTPDGGQKQVLARVSYPAQPRRRRAARR
jgi:hypothetical protein